MFEQTRKPIREHLNEALAALGALQSVSHLVKPPGEAVSSPTLLADYQLVLGRLEQEATEAIRAVASELRKPTVGELVDRLWKSGPLTFQQIRAAVVETEAPSGQIELLLNRLHNAGLLEASAGPTAATDARQQDAVTLSPLNRLQAEGAVEITRRVPVSGLEASTAVGGPADPDVTSTYSSLITAKGREWFDERAAAQGIDLHERINCQF